VTSFKIHGSLVIGIDGKLGGITLDNNYIALPIPQGEISYIPIQSLPKYFPNGYVILENPYNWVQYAGNFDTTVILNNTVICQENCSGSLAMSNLIKGNIFIYNNILIYYFTSPYLEAEFNGFLSEFDPNLGKGNFNVTFCWVSWYGYGFIDTNSKNNIIIHQNGKKNYFNGTVEFKLIGGSGIFYLYSIFS